MTTNQPPAKPDLHTGNRKLNSYLREHTAAGDTGLLGSVVLMSIGTVEPVTHSELRNWFTELELAPAYLPGEPRPVDAYERATGSAKTKYPLGTNPNGRKKQTHEKTGQTITLMMRHVVRDETRIVRHLVRELADHADESLSYEVKLVEAEFEREINPNLPHGGDGDMNLAVVEEEIERLGADERNVITALIDQMHKDYEHARSYIASSRLSKMLRDYLERLLGGIRLQSGVYFVPRNHGEALTSLRELAGRCGATINRIPLPDTAEQRAMVGDAFIAKCGADLDSLARDIAREISDGAAAYRVSKLHTRFLEVKREAEEYQANLDAELGDTATRLDTINAQMESLFRAAGTQDDEQ